jgi:uncharacterized membrane-anchored protein YjiN (DUF445 family)
MDRPPVREAMVELVDDLLDRYRRRLHLRGRLALELAELLGLIDRDRLAGAVVAGLRGVAADPEHPLRREIAESLGALPGRLRTDAELARRVETLKAELLESAAVTRLVEQAAPGLQAVLAADLATSEPGTVGWIVDRLEEARRALLADAALRLDLEGWARRHVVSWIDRHHDRIALLVEHGVRALGPAGAFRLIEEHAGDDLQYIRVNGTLVGGLAGGALYAVHLLVRWLAERGG